MNVILGATGQIGSMLAANLRKKGQPVRAVIRNESKAQDLQRLGIEVVIADYRDPIALNKALHGGRSVFLLTPEDPSAERYMNEVEMMIASYREAVQSTAVAKVVGLSSMGAQNDAGTGNLYASYLLENAFTDIAVEQVFVRPAYYYSNWMGYWELVQDQAILPTFFPPDLALEMIAPPDVAEFLAEVMLRQEPQQRMYEISGPQPYRTSDIARIFEEVINKPVTVQQIMPDAWESTLMEAGFSRDAARNLMQMTQAVVDGKTKGELPELIRCSTNFEAYVNKSLA